MLSQTFLLKLHGALLILQNVNQEHPLMVSCFYTCYFEVPLFTASSNGTFFSVFPFFFLRVECSKIYGSVLEFFTLCCCIYYAAFTTTGAKRGRSLLIDEGALPWIVQNANNEVSPIRRHIELALCHLAQHGESSFLS